MGVNAVIFWLEVIGLTLQRHLSLINMKERAWNPEALPGGARAAKQRAQQQGPQRQVPLYSAVHCLRTFPAE